VTTTPRHIALVVGEESGDQLGYKLMAALRARLPDLRFSGVGGPAMAREGLRSLFPLDDIAVMGFAAVIERFPVIYRRAWHAIDAIVGDPPDALVIIDSPDFTHAVAKRVRKRLPTLPIVDYVSPSVWAWRPGRARRMKAYVDHVLALLPFEPDAYRRLDGPPCSYVGHPLIERLDEFRPSRDEELRRAADPPLVLALPGSRGTEIARLGAVFGEALARLQAIAGSCEIVVPTVARRAERVSAIAADWPVRATVLVDETEKRAAFRTARAALAASGTVTLELALAGVPHIGAYRVPAWEAVLARRLIQVPTVLLPNLILGDNVVPEYLQEAASPDALAAALAPLLSDGPERQAQLDAFARLDRLMALGGEEPSERAARIVLETMAEKPRR
jgi:lipid-A-disaccharide synthase